jgi:uncharacterized protein
MRRYLFPGFCVIVLVLALHTMTIASGIALPVEPVEIVTTGGETHVFSAYIADTPEARSRGLMYVTRLELDRGMLFDFESPRPVYIWMKNTPLSLDILFIDEHGLIARIEPRTRPFSTAAIPSGSDVRAVLELNGGTAARLGIATGDRVLHRLFD